MGRHSDKIIYILVGLFIVYTVIISSLTLYHTHQVITGRAAGTIDFCINAMPRINMSNCSSSVIQDTLYQCMANATDADHDEITFTSKFITSNSLFTVSSLGFIQFTPDSQDVGNHTVNISALDNKCKKPGSWELFQIEVTNVNDAPYLNVSVPAIRMFEGYTMRSVFLDDHFVDPDGDVMTYTHTLTGVFNIEILSSSQIVVTANQCPASAVIIFTAADPSNASGTSNPVLIECLEPSDGASAAGSGGGGGGGGGGGLSLDCAPKLICLDWEKCQSDGRQRRKCFDEYACKDGMWYVYRECDYIEQCQNEVWDWNEEGVDCGGPCPPCPTCFDGILNGNEEQVDCGGDCGACVDDLVLFSEWYPVPGYERGNLSRKWKVSVLDVQAGQIEVIRDDIEEVPSGAFTPNGSTVAYTDSGTIWQTARKSGFTRRIGSEDMALGLTYVYEGIIFSKAKYIEELLSPRLYHINPNTLEERAIPGHTDYGPMYDPSALLNKGMVAYATGHFEPNFTKRGFKKSYPDYIFGKVLLPDESSIHVLDHQYEEVLRLDERGHSLYGPSLSPDGKYLAYYVYDEYQSDLWVMKTDGSYKKQLTDTPQYNEIYPRFSRDSKHILFSADYKGIYALYATDINGSSRQLILESPNPLFCLDWYYGPSCFDGIQNQDETAIDCGGVCGMCGTCWDGKKNQNEEGTDCGGVCAPCRALERPALLAPQNRWILVGGGLSIILLIVLGILFWKRIRSLVRRIWDWARHKDRRQILINLAMKRDLLRRISELEAMFHDKDFKDVIVTYILIARDYVANVAKMSPEFDYEELQKSLHKSRVKGLLKVLLGDFSNELNGIEFGSLQLDEFSLRMHIETLRYLVLITSPIDPADLKRDQYELIPEHERHQIIVMVRDILVALQFQELEQAKKQYRLLIRLYNKLDPQEQTRHYGHIKKAFDYAKYTYGLLKP